MRGAVSYALIVNYVHRAKGTKTAEQIVLVSTVLGVVLVNCVAFGIILPIISHFLTRKKKEILSPEAAEMRETRALVTMALDVSATRMPNGLLRPRLEDTLLTDGLTNRMSFTSPLREDRIRLVGFTKNSSRDHATDFGSTIGIVQDSSLRREQTDPGEDIENVCINLPPRRGYTHLVTYTSARSNPLLERLLCPTDGESPCGTDLSCSHATTPEYPGTNDVTRKSVLVPKYNYAKGLRRGLHRWWHDFDNRIMKPLFGGKREDPSLFSDFNSFGGSPHQSSHVALSHTVETYEQLLRQILTAEAPV